MQDYELREEVKYDGKVYFLQTRYKPDENVIQSSIFRSGNLLNSSIKKVGENLSNSKLRDLTKEIHTKNKRDIKFLLTARDKVRDSGDPKHHIKLSEALYRRNLLPEAVEEARMAIAKNSSDSKPYVIMGRAYYEMDDYEKALKSIKNGIEINPDYPDLLNMLGLIYLKRNKCTESIKNFKKAIELNQYYGEAYLNLARAYVLNSVVKDNYELSKNLDSNVLSNLEMSSRLIPDFEDLFIEKIRVFLEDKNYEEAYNYLVDKSTREKGDDIRDLMLNIYIMLIHGEDGLLEEEIEMYLERVEEEVNRNPTFADGYNNLGILYAAKCKIMIDKAGEAFQRAVEINSDYKEAIKNLRLTENDRQGVFILLKALLD